MTEEKIIDFVIHHHKNMPDRDGWVKLTKLSFEKEVEEWDQVKVIKDFFDDFVFHARVMPVLTALFPVIVWGVFTGVINGNFFEVSIYVFVALIFLSFASKIAREMGKKYEQKMYSELKGMPTTIVMRFTDNTINNASKVRYHKILNEKCHDIYLPLRIEDENGDSDDMYLSAMTYLRNYANDNRDSQPRVYQELKDYNFWRNLYGSKTFALIIYVFIGIREVVLNKSFDFVVLFEKPYPEYIAFLLMLCSVIAMCVFVNKNTVKRKAFDYAKTLAEVCETIQ